MRQITVAQYGCGKMAEYIMRYVYEKGGQVVAAFDVDEAVIGKDIGEIMGTESKGVQVEHADKAGERLGELHPDVCMIATKSLLREVEEAYRICATNGVNAISICEEALYPWNSSPEIARSLDRLAKSRCCTLTGTGYQDVFWCNLLTTIAGACQRITKIKGVSCYNVEDYGIALAQAHGAGLTVEEFERQIASVNAHPPQEIQRLIDAGEFLPSYMWNVNGWMVAEWRLEKISQVQKCIPRIAKEDIVSKTLGITIPKGHVCGMSAQVITETREGLTLETECIGFVYGPDECDVNDWTIYGEPDTRIVIERPNTVALTCATMVNRIPDIINASPGFVTSNWLPVNRFRPHTLDRYIEDDKNTSCILYPKDEARICGKDGICR